MEYDDDVSRELIKCVVVGDTGELLVSFFN